jgi:sugar O-acyltransferase (sialic acid O-acetyltransferase NeuD family)
MKHLVIIGARGWGREMYAAARNTVAYHNREFDIKGFLDDKADALDGLKGDFPPILGPVETYQIASDDVFFCAMGDPEWRKHYVEIISNRGGEFITVINPTARINPTAMIGDGSYVGAYSIISDNVTIGRHTILQCFNDIGHDVVIGDYVSVESYVFLGGGAKVGDKSTMHTKSSVIPHKRVGDNCVVGINSVVMKNISDGKTVFGIPAKDIL